MSELDAQTPLIPMSRMNRLMAGDHVSYDDPNTWPVEKLEGVITGFDNAEMTYLVVDFGNGDVRTLTEDEVTRIA